MVSKENEGEEEIWSSWLLSPEILDQSPSRKDGVKEEEEKTYRRRTSIFIEEVASSLKLDWQTQATAQVFFHFFFAHHSFRRHKRFDVAVACIFLSAKVEECDDKNGARHLEYLITKADKLWNRKAGNTYQGLVKGSEAYNTLQRAILECERNLLHTVAFDLIVKKPHEYLVNQIKELVECNFVEDSMKKNFGRTTMHLLKMSLRTSLCLQVIPPFISAVCLSLAAIYHDLPKPTVGDQDGNVIEWYQLFELDFDSFQCITIQIVEALHVDAELVGAQEFQAKLFANRIIPKPFVERKNSISSSHTNKTSSISSSSQTSKQSLPPPPPPPSSTTTVGLDSTKTHEIKRQKC